MSETKLCFNLEFEVKVTEDSLVIQNIVKHEGAIIKSTAYVYTDNEVKSIDGSKIYTTKLKSKKTFALLKEYIIDILENPRITPLTKYLVLTRYSKNSMLSTEAGKSFISKLVDQVLIDKKEKKEAKKDEKGEAFKPAKRDSSKQTS